MLKFTGVNYLLYSDPPTIAVRIEGEHGLFAMGADQYAELGGQPPIDELTFGAAPYEIGLAFTDGHTIDQSKRFFSTLATPK